jgi:hypothetical protein
MPPLQDLSFDLGAAWDKMQKIIPRGGSGQLAVNVSMAHRESAFVSVLKTIQSESAALPRSWACLQSAQLR